MDDPDIYFAGSSHGSRKRSAEVYDIDANKRPRNTPYDYVQGISMASNDLLTGSHTAARMEQQYERYRMSEEAQISNAAHAYMNNQHVSTSPSYQPQPQVSGYPIQQASYMVNGGVPARSTLKPTLRVIPPTAEVPYLPSAYNATQQHSTEEAAALLHNQPTTTNCNGGYTNVSYGRNLAYSSVLALQQHGNSHPQYGQFTATSPQDYSMQLGNNSHTRGQNFHPNQFSVSRRQPARHNAPRPHQDSLTAGSSHDQGLPPSATSMGYTVSIRVPFTKSPRNRNQVAQASQQVALQQLLPNTLYLQRSWLPKALEQLKPRPNLQPRPDAETQPISKPHPMFGVPGIKPYIRVHKNDYTTDPSLGASPFLPDSILLIRHLQPRERYLMYHHYWSASLRAVKAAGTREKESQKLFQRLWPQLVEVSDRLRQREIQWFGQREGDRTLNQELVGQQQHWFLQDLGLGHILAKWHTILYGPSTSAPQAPQPETQQSVPQGVTSLPQDANIPSLRTTPGGYPVTPVIQSAPRAAISRQGPISSMNEGSRTARYQPDSTSQINTSAAVHQQDSYATLEEYYVPMAQNEGQTAAKVNNAPEILSSDEELLSRYDFEKTKPPHNECQLTDQPHMASIEQNTQVYGHTDEPRDGPSSTEPSSDCLWQSSATNLPDSDATFRTDLSSATGAPQPGETIYSLQTSNFTDPIAKMPVPTECHPDDDIISPPVCVTQAVGGAQGDASNVPVQRSTNVSRGMKRRGSFDSEQPKKQMCIERDEHVHSSTDDATPTKTQEHIDVTKEQDASEPSNVEPKPSRQSFAGSKNVLELEDFTEQMKDPEARKELEKKLLQHDNKSGRGKPKYDWELMGKAQQRPHVDTIKKTQRELAKAKKIKAKVTTPKQPKRAKFQCSFDSDVENHRKDGEANRYLCSHQALQKKPNCIGRVCEHECCRDGVDQATLKKAIWTKKSREKRIANSGVKSTIPSKKKTELGPVISEAAKLKALEPADDSPGEVWKKTKAKKITDDENVEVIELDLGWLSGNTIEDNEAEEASERGSDWDPLCDDAE